MSRTRAVEHDRTGARSDRQPPPARCGCAPGATARLTFTTGYADTEAARARADREVSRPARHRARALRWPRAHVPDRAAASRPDDGGHASRSNVWAGACSIGDPRLRDRRSRRSATAAASASSGSTASPATCRSLLVRVDGRHRDPARRRAAEGARIPAAQGAGRSISSSSTSTRSRYLQSLHDTLEQMIDSSPEQLLDRQAGRRVPSPRRPDVAGRPDAAARGRARGHGRRRRPAAQPARASARAVRARAAHGAEIAAATGAIAAAPATASPASRGDLEFFNGFGGFAADGREYIVANRRSAMPPAPWTNVVAHATFGFACTESGAGLHVVGEQPRQPADAVAQRSGRDPPGEAVFIRDEETGAFWSATPLPAGDGSRLSDPARPGLQRLRAHAATASRRS